MKDFRSHLWDIFVYIGLGALVVLMVGAHDVLVGTRGLSSALDFLSRVPYSHIR